MRNKNTRPLIGIITSKKANGSLAGNGPLFKQLQKKLISLNGVSFVFTQEDVEEDSILGFTYSVEKDRWIKDIFPYPNLVYNRIPFRKTEQDVTNKVFFTKLKEKNIPFFNPCFIDKYELFEMMKNHEILERFLPKTIRVNQKEDLLFFLIKYNSIYLKPSQSAKGKGIFRIKRLDSEEIQLDAINTSKRFCSFDDFWEEWKKDLLEKNYLAQEEIESSKFDGARFDFRILAHGYDDTYILTGVGIRQSQKQVITTHIPSGGKLLPYKLLQTKEHDQFFQFILPHIGKALSNQFGYFGEFSIDACINENGEYYIFEVNSKPMSFDELEIEEKKIEQLCRLFLQLTEKQS